MRTDKHSTYFAGEVASAFASDFINDETAVHVRQPQYGDKWIEITYSDGRVKNVKIPRDAQNIISKVDALFMREVRKTFKLPKLPRRQKYQRQSAQTNFGGVFG